MGQESFRSISFEDAASTVFADALADMDLTNWMPFLRSLDGRAPATCQKQTFTTCTGRTEPFLTRPRQTQACCGRRGGKTRIGALLVSTAAAFWDHSQYLARGERAKVLLLSQSKDQASQAKNYALALLESNPITAPLIEGSTGEEIRLRNRCDLSIRSASFRGVRGFSTPMVLADEVCFWRDEATSTNPAKEIFRSLTPGMSNVPQPLMLSISTPWSKEGIFYETHQKHFGNDDSQVLIWRGPSALMNPTLDPEIITQALADDPEAASAEYLAEFRSDLASFVNRDVVMACIEAGRLERPHIDGMRYVGFVDPSSGSQDSMTLGIAHADKGTAVLDVLREARPPFDPSVVVEQFAATLKAYGLRSVEGDAYATGFVREAFRRHGVNYTLSKQNRSELYLSFLPLLNSGTAQLLDSSKLINQLCNLQRRTGPSGRSSIDHPRHQHDDLANAAAGACVMANRKKRDRVLVGARLIDGYGLDLSPLAHADDAETREYMRQGLGSPYGWGG